MEGTTPLNAMRRDLLALRERKLKGEDVERELQALAEECARVYNEAAARVAKETGYRTSKMTAKQMIKGCGFIG